MKIAIIGLSSFGAQLAISLAKDGHDVTALDVDRNRVDQIKSSVPFAVVMNATDKDSLKALGLKDMDIVVVSIGPAMEASILAVHYLNELGVRRIVAKALSEDHAQILEAVGATEVVYPERDMAIKIAHRLIYPNVLEYVEVSAGVHIQELSPPGSFIGKSLRDLDLINRFGVQVLAVREFVPERLTYIPKADFVVKDSDVLIVMGEEDKLNKINKLRD
ncbi:MAG TPA: TrkA family potassium uptake protein [Candidatus Aminicenantes bacterium]|nr:TrkA family potassium uptake protein [Candidatus Aminicenantes bacterium]HDT14246.1 TrkA family potassium uptake protein [Candidatus Aminicenantes bacterium]